MKCLPPSNSIRWKDMDFINVGIKKFELPFSLKEKTIVFTSKNAVNALVKWYPNEKFKEAFVYCVGEKTKALLEDNEIEVHGVSPYSKDLSLQLVQDKTREIILFCGNLRRAELKEAALAHGIVYQEIEVYETTLTPHELSEDFDGIVFFSPSAVQSFAELNSPKNSIAFCIGTSTANAASKYFKQVLISDDLTIESVLDKVKEYDGN
ncbi:uroporphyrinogen-III synthase [Putridiphycobacter roseus]|uniref:Uroporphyrinogen-III synthase n=1 Tax=Putridiphycobacter roseus TaxID=2219161 RepID=A0A2W1N2B2_9FLAO|nr:uroporphyrinogen-III synthase [Putridiphycobacter roseus]PZE18789.1 uroporphyrinogen-III synthase [Putridiphycobacter roseus]